MAHSDDLCYAPPTSTLPTFFLTHLTFLEAHMEEQWKSVDPFHDGAYEISSAGSVRSSITGRLLKAQRSSRNGHPYVILTVYTRNGGTFSKKTVRRSVPLLVARAFLPPNVHGYPYVTMVDGNQSNMEAQNLRWTDYNRAIPREILESQPLSPPDTPHIPVSLPKSPPPAPVDPRVQSLLDEWGDDNQ
jgi:hypothetical protein